MREAWLVRAGRVDYAQAWQLQKRLAEERAHGHIPDVLLLLEHPRTYTVGRSGTREHVLADEATLKRLGASVLDVDRGGDVTYHGPGQLVGYPIFQLTSGRGSVRGYLRDLEEALIGAVAQFGVIARRDPAYTGVWVGTEKLAAIGVKVTGRGVTLHGFALNINTELSDFNHIVPCGITDRGVTSLARLGAVAACRVRPGCQTVDETPAAEAVAQEIGRVFGLTMRETPLMQLLWAATKEEYAE